MFKTNLGTFHFLNQLHLFVCRTQNMNMGFLERVFFQFCMILFNSRGESIVTNKHSNGEEIYILYIYTYCHPFSTVRSDGTTCYGRFAEESKNKFHCPAVFHQPVCLICHISSFSESVSWYYKGYELARNELNFDSSHAGGLVVNEGCNSARYSLKFVSPSGENMNGVYYCQNKGRNVSYFLVTFQGIYKYLYHDLYFHLEGSPFPLFTFWG